GQEHVGHVDAQRPRAQRLHQRRGCAAPLLMPRRMERHDAGVGISLHGFEKRRFVLVQTRADGLLAWAVSQFHYTTVKVCARAPAGTAAAGLGARPPAAGGPNAGISGVVASIIKKTLFLSF